MCRTFGIVSTSITYANGYVINEEAATWPCERSDLILYFLRFSKVSKSLVCRCRFSRIRQHRLSAGVVSVACDWNRSYVGTVTVACDRNRSSAETVSVACDRNHSTAETVSVGCDRNCSSAGIVSFAWDRNRPSAEMAQICRRPATSLRQVI
jgi:hypothetical protein